MPNNNPINFTHTHICIIIIFSLMCIGRCAHSEQSNSNNDQVIKYKSCSSNLCFSCYNEFFCQSCAFNVLCCPKYCKSCKNMTYCNVCQNGFELVRFYGEDNWQACSNTNSSIDPKRITTDPTKCKKGYYFDEILQFCQQCLIPNCKLCQQSIHCKECQSGFIWTDGMCIAPQIKPTPSDQINPIQTCNKQEQQGLYWGFMMIGMIIGLCFSCILIKICSSIKKRCGACCEWLLNKCSSKKRVQKQRLIIEPQISHYVEMQAPPLNDQQKQFAIISEMKQEKDIDYIIRDNLDAKYKRKFVVTEEKNKY